MKLDTSKDLRKSEPELESYKGIEEVLPSLGLDGLELCGCIIAGGAIRDLLTKVDIKDIDIFGTPENVSRFFEANVNKMAGLCRTSPLGHVNTNIVGCEYPIQIIKTKCAENVHTLLTDFDLRFCRFAYDGDTIFHDREAFYDIKEKKIYVASFHTPLLTLTRMPKYFDRGYTVEPQRYKTLLKAVRDMTTAQYRKEAELIAKCDYDGGFPA